jgi:hypothetical protein
VSEGFRDLVVNLRDQQQDAGYSIEAMESGELGEAVMHYQMCLYLGGSNKGLAAARLAKAVVDFSAVSDGDTHIYHDADYYLWRYTEARELAREGEVRMRVSQRVADV